MRKPNLVILGVTGGIAAYKAAELCSMLRRNGFEVQVLMTDNATRFITPLTFRTLSQRPVVTSLWEVPEWRPEHIALADEAAFFVVAPATANFLAKYANGIADDALSTFAATFGGPVLLAPAACLTLFCLSIHLIADCLRDRLDYDDGGARML